jgi:bacteriocin biosynthesis cyclodehydratase domain-containing protein
MTREEELLLVSAGADRLYALEDVDETTAFELMAAWHCGSIDPESLSSSAGAAFDELLAAGIIERRLPAGSPRRIGWRWVGTPRRDLDSELARQVQAHPSLRASSFADSELGIFLRTDGLLQDICDDTYSTLTIPHLLVDAAYHHTVSIGPLVFPGESACLACLVGRVVHSWGDVPPPPEPRVLASASLIAALATLEFGRIADGEYLLANATVVFDFEGPEVRRNSVYKLPWCPVCAPRAAMDDIGSIRLPWAAAA